MSGARRSLVVCVVLAGLLVPSASAIELTIYPGVGIGKVRLGMTKAQVERALGNSPIVNAQEGGYTEFAWEFGTSTVGFERGRAVQISTTLASQRTKKGVGPARTTWQALMRAYPGGRCAWNGQFDSLGHPLAYWAEYLVGHQGGSQTLYLFSRRGNMRNGVPFAVNEVVVRTAFRPLPEFAPTWMLHCTGDWRHARAPGINVGRG